MLEPLVAFVIAVGHHDPVDSVPREDISIASSAVSADSESVSEVEYASIAKYAPATGIVIDADQYLPYD